MKYLAWERDYKSETHRRWEEALNQDDCSRLLDKANTQRSQPRGPHRTTIATQHDFLVRKDGLRDAVKSEAGAGRLALVCTSFFMDARPTKRVCPLV